MAYLIIRNPKTGATVAVRDEGNAERLYPDHEILGFEGDVPTSQIGVPAAADQGEDSAPLDLLGELSDDEFAALTPAQKGARTKAAKAAADQGEDDSDPDD